MDRQQECQDGGRKFTRVAGSSPATPGTDWWWVSITGEPLTGGNHEPGPPAPFPETIANTTLVVIATDAVMTRSTLSRLAVRAHDAMAVCIRPVHTRFDGDIVFAVSCGEIEADVETLAEAAFGATAAAIERAVRASAG